MRESKTPPKIKSSEIQEKWSKFLLQLFHNLSYGGCTLGPPDHTFCSSLHSFYNPIRNYKHPHFCMMLDWSSGHATFRQESRRCCCDKRNSATNVEQPTYISHAIVMAPLHPSRHKGKHWNCAVDSENPKQPLSGIPI